MRQTPSQHRAEILYKHGLKAKRFDFKGGREFLLLQARSPLHGEELDMVGKWFSSFELESLCSRFEEADAIRRAEAKAERAEQRQEFIRQKYWW